MNPFTQRNISCLKNIVYHDTENLNNPQQKYFTDFLCEYLFIFGFYMPRILILVPVFDSVLIAEYM